MIIEASQLSDLDGDFEFYYDQSYAYRGQYSLFINIKDLLMLKDGEVSIWARHKFVNPINYIPFLHWLGVRRRGHKFNVYDDLIKIADITYERRFHKSRYVIQLSNSDTLYAYEYYKSKFYYISIYIPAIISGIFRMQSCKTISFFYMINDIQMEKVNTSIFLQCRSGF